MSLRAFLLSTLVLIAPSVPARAQDDFIKVLLPIMVAEPVQGAFGSLWESELFAYNSSDVPISPIIFGSCSPFPECPAVLNPGIMLKANSVGHITPLSGDTHGVLFPIPVSAIDALHLNLRIKDVSRQSLTWGTEIPVVYPEEAFEGTIDLVGIPTGDRFRQTLRVYSFGQPLSPGVQVRAFDASGSLLFDTRLTLRGPANPMLDAYRPGYADIPWIVGSFPDASAASEIRIQVEPEQAGLPIWAMVSITNNETQHVTMITPQR